MATLPTPAPGSPVTAEDSSCDCETTGVGNPADNSDDARFDSYEAPTELLGSGLSATLSANELAGIGGAEGPPVIDGELSPGKDALDTGTMPGLAVEAEGAGFVEDEEEREDDSLRVSAPVALLEMGGRDPSAVTVDGAAGRMTGSSGALLASTESVKPPVDSL